MKSTRANDGRKLTSSAKESLRKRAVLQIELGESPAIVADTQGINRRTVYRWLERYRKLPRQVDSSKVENPAFRA